MKVSSSGNQDLVKVYLNQMSDIPPISVDEERVLAANLETTRKELRDPIGPAGDVGAMVEQVLEHLVDEGRRIGNVLNHHERRNEVERGVGEGDGRIGRHQPKPLRVHQLRMPFQIGPPHLAFS